MSSMNHTMFTLFERIKEDEWRWMEEMLSIQEQVVPPPLREHPLTRGALKVAMVIGLVPVGLKSLLENLGYEPEPADSLG